MQLGVSEGAYALGFDTMGVSATAGLCLGVPAPGANGCDRGHRPDDADDSDATRGTQLGVKLVAARRGFVSNLPGRYSGQQRSSLGDDLTDSCRTFNDLESQRSDFLACQTSERGHNENPFWRQQEPYFFQRFARLGEFVQIDQQYARFHARATIDSRNGPRVNGHNFVALLDQLRA
jgi:hypothetical protein